MQKLVDAIGLTAAALILISPWIIAFAAVEAFLWFMLSSM